MADLQEIRGRIDAIDSEILRLFRERMETADEVAAYKREAKLPILDKGRERQKIADVAAQLPEEMRDSATVLFSHLMESSRARQYGIIEGDTALVDSIADALKNTEPLFPSSPFVACQGIEGANSQIAADKLFKHASISYFDTFEGVFRAIDQGFCEYGVLPLENSTAGSVNAVYDLMMAYNCYIARSVRLKVDHNLLVKPGVTADKITEIYSHEQALAQCSNFLSDLEGVQVHVCDNTAAAAKMVAESDRDDIAALSSRSCAELYGLEILERGVQDNDNNYTRFACISKKLEIFPGANRTSLMLVVNHEPGSLYKVLSRFYSLDINLLKLESRPLPDRDFEFMFYFDLECQVAAPEFRTLILSLPDVCEEVRFLGAYSEIV